jgi:hypothetical protein
MARLDRRVLREHEERILQGLASFYYQGGHTSEAYRDDDTGGVYEHKLAHRLGYKLAGDRSPAEFIEACRALESQGFVRRTKRSPDFPEMGIWPTLAGLDRAEYLEAPAIKKAWRQLAKRWPEILVAITTTVVTLAISSFFGLFGIKR